MDDGSGGHSTLRATKASRRSKIDLLKAGFVPSEKKCEWEPTQIVEMLGRIVDMKNGTIRATESGVES